jgi:transposase
MKPSRVTDAENVILGLQDEIRRCQESRYDHRLHGILLVAQGLSCREVAWLLGDAPRTVAYWVKRFEEEGLSGLAEGDRTGRPRRLTEEQREVLAEALRHGPLEYGLSSNLWDGKTLSMFIEQNWNVELGVRQCQRMFREFGFRLRKPRPVIAKANPVEQKKYKKTSSSCEKQEG